MKESSRKFQRATSPPGAPVYFFGLIGALVYYVGIADGFWPIVLAVLKAIIWPAFLVYDLLKFIA